MIKCLTVVISAFFFLKCTTSKGHLEEITIFQTNGRMGHCSKSKLHHWDWAKVLLYRWPRLMSSVCASLMFTASREQTASHRVLSNEDDNSNWNMAGCRYVNHSHLVTGLFIAAFICEKTEKLPCLKNHNNMSSISSPPLSHLSQNLPRTCKYKSALTS